MDSYMKNLTSRMPGSLRSCMVAFLVLFVFHVSPASPQQDKWLELGKGQVANASSSAFIPLDSNKGTVCALRLQQEGSGLEIEEIIVHFSNSQSMHLALPKTIELGGSDYSRVVDLPGPRRSVRGVEIVYRLVDSGQAAPTVKLWGNTHPLADNCPGYLR